MKKPAYLLFILAFLTMQGYSQMVYHHYPGKDEKKTPRPETKFCIKTAPLAYIDVYGSVSWRLGTEFKLSGNHSLSLEYGRYYSYGRKIDIRHDSKGYIFRGEFKKYLNKAELCAGKFLSVECLYKDISFNYQDSLKDGNNPAFTKEYTIFKHISAVTFKYGELTVHSNGFVFEWFGGAGIRICRGRNTLTPQENKEVLTGEGHGDVIGYGMRWINYVAPNFSAGFKIGYSFK